MLKILNKFKKQQVRAFTLIETLAAIVIITTTILGPLTVANNASSYARRTKDTITANYLAQEAIELLRHHQDSLYLRCTGKNASGCNLLNNETPSEAAWRMLKDRLSSNTQGDSCFGTTISNGCTYDFIDMTKDETLNPSKYSVSSNSCKTLSISPEGFYVCTGVHSSQGYANSPFSRSIYITSIPTISGADATYNDDLRVTVIVSFNQSTGYYRQVKVVDFMHARQ